MSGKEIRNFEFKVNNAQVFFNEQGKVKYKGNKKGKKQLEQLQPLFDAIAKADNSHNSHDKKVDSQKEKDLMSKLHQLLMADGTVDANELKLGDEFTKSGLTAEAFINKKVNEANQAAIDKVVEQVVAETKLPEETKPDENPAPVEQKPVEPQQTPVKDEEQKPPVQQAQQRPDPRVSQKAYNQTIQNQAQRLEGKRAELESAFTNVQTVQRGSTLYKIALDALKAEGVEKPSPKQINTRIAEIAMLNNIPNVNNVKVGTSLKVGRGTVADAGASGNISNAPTQSPVKQQQGTTQVVKTVAPSTINVLERTAVETLMDLEYQAEDKEVAAEGEEAAWSYKEWTKDGSANMYTTSVGGITLAAASLDELKNIRTQYNAAEIKAAPADEADDAKAARQAENLANMKKRIELAGGDVIAIKAVIAEMRTEGNVDLKSAEVQAFVQDLIRTKNVEVLDALVLVDGTDEDGNSVKNFDVSLLANDKTSAETLASLYTEIRAKENAGVKLTDEEVDLKEFINTNISAGNLYTRAADEDNGLPEVNMHIYNNVDGICFRVVLNGSNYYAQDQSKLDNFVKDYKAANGNPEKLAEVFKNYVNTDDRELAYSLAMHADIMQAKKDDVLTLVENNGLKVLTGLSYSPVATVSENELDGYTAEDKVDGEGDNEFSYKLYTKEGADPVYTAEFNGKTIKAESVEALRTAIADYKEFNNKIGERAVVSYTDKAQKGDPANMRYIEEAFALIEAMDKTDDEKLALKNHILESYFEVTETTEGEDAVTTKTYKFKPSRRPTEEEICAFYDKAAEEMKKAVVESITVDDMGKGSWVAGLEYNEGVETYMVPHFANLISEMDEAGVIDFIQNKVIYKSCDIPFDKAMEMFPDSAELKAELLKHLACNSTCADANRVAILQTVLSEDKKSIDTAKLPNDVTVYDLIGKLPAKCDGETAAEGAVEVFNAVFAGLGKDDLDSIKEMAGKVDDKNNVKAKLTGLISACTVADVDYLADMAAKFSDTININNEVKAKLVELVTNNSKNKELIVKVARLSNSSIVPYGALRNIDAQAAGWDNATKAVVFKSTIDRFNVNKKAELLANAVARHLVTKLDEDRYQIGNTVYLTDWSYNDGDVEFIVLHKVSKTGYDRGQDMFKQVDGLGSGKIYDMVMGKGDFANYMTTYNITGILQAFIDKSPNEGLMEFLYNETTDYSEGFCSRVPKMLMRKAQQLGLQDTPSYKALAEYYGAQGKSKCTNGHPTEGDTFKFTQHVGDKEPSKDDAKKLDIMIKGLTYEIIRKS